jgi:putative heme-binding domain-containing protein
LITPDSGQQDALENAWRLAGGSVDTLRDLLHAVPLIPDPRLRAQAHRRLEPLLHELPESLSEIEVTDERAGSIQQAAIDAITYTEVEPAKTFETLVGFVLENRQREAAIRALSRIPRRHWVAPQVATLADNIIQHIEQIPAGARTAPPVLDELALGNNLAAALPRRKAKQVRRALRELGVQVLRLRPVPHRMLFDRRQLFIEAGKPVELILENVDIMPHNLVIGSPGSYAQIGLAAEEMATQPDAYELEFVPDLPQVLHATRLLQPGQTDRLSFTAPAAVGEYPYLCTFPGHWRRMYGTLHVVENLDDAPLEALAPASDPDILARPFVRNWTVSDLVDLLEFDGGRNFDRGQALFSRMSCLQCHRVGNEGGLVGPQLGELKSKLERGETSYRDVLESVVNPSSKIDAKYRTVIIQDVNGRLSTGIVSRRDEQELILLANPLDSRQPIRIRLEDIEEEIESKVSLMPAGLLNTLQPEEILDLLAYVIAAGDRQHPAFD